MANRPFYRYSGLNELIGFKEYYGLPRGHEHSHTAISRKVVGKSARNNPERYCGWF